MINTLGFIEYVGHAESEDSVDLLRTFPPVTTIPLGSFLIPTFCDLHLHAPQFLYQGTGLHLPLMEWLNEYAFKAEERMDADAELARRVYTCLAERLVENGTGAVLLFGTIKEETKCVLRVIRITIFAKRVQSHTSRGDAKCWNSSIHREVIHGYLVSSILRRSIS